jgi:hypothetical protein
MVTRNSYTRKGKNVSRFSGQLGRLAALGAVSVCAATAFVVIGTSGVAQADVCGVARDGTTSWSTSVGTPNWSPLRSVWTKAAPGCHDYNIVRVASTGNYAGYLQRSNGTWFECAAGYISIPGGRTGDWVECTNVATGTHMTTDTLQFPGGVAYRVNI